MMMMTSTSFRVVFTTSTFGWARADYTWTPARHKCSSSAVDTMSINLQSIMHIINVVVYCRRRRLSTRSWRCHWQPVVNGRPRVVSLSFSVLSPVTDQTHTAVSVTWRCILVRAFTSSRLDYCNSVLYGVTDNLLQRLQSVQNAAARLMTRTGRREHISPVVQELHWLPVQRAVWTSNCQHSCSSRYTVARRRICQGRVELRRALGSILIFGNDP